MINRPPSRASSDSIRDGSSTALLQKLVDLRLYLRRRRYGASHGVGLLHRLPGLEGTYAVALTAPHAYLQQFWDTTYHTVVSRLARKESLALGTQAENCLVD